MEFRNKITGQIETILSPADAKSLMASQAWELVETKQVKEPVKEVTAEKPKTKEKKESLLSKLFN